VGLVYDPRGLPGVTTVRPEVLAVLQPRPIEKQVSILYMHHVFRIFQKEVVAARDHCFVVQILQHNGVKIIIIND
jgi:hypothetical protein